MVSRQNPKKPLLSSVKTILDVLREFSCDEPEKGVREVSESLGISKSVVHRIMATLASEGFLEQDPSTRKYRLGVPFLSLSSIVTLNFDAHKMAYSIYSELADKLGESVYVTSLKGIQVDYLYSFKSKYPHKHFLKVGKFNPVHCTSAGKVLIAYHDDPEFIEQVIQNGLISYTQHTITDPVLFRREIMKVREQGYSVSMEEFGKGGVSIAAPLRDYSGGVNFAINVNSSLRHMRPSNIPYYVEEIKKAAHRISEVISEWEFQRKW